MKENILAFFAGGMVVVILLITLIAGMVWGIRLGKKDKESK
jgi:hypothetical protein